eukprot:GHVT01054809.1.p1 GENE.GHVT01054809.1~~GHVT01054809.1.p1  ORF type:complete len:175 (-),score=2.86 GHVT01054809.1:794-1318(-)
MCVLSNHTPTQSDCPFEQVTCVCPLHCPTLSTAPNPTPIADISSYSPRTIGLACLGLFAVVAAIPLIAKHCCRSKQSRDYQRNIENTDFTRFITNFSYQHGSSTTTTHASPSPPYSGPAIISPEPPLSADIHGFQPDNPFALTPVAGLPEYDVASKPLPTYKESQQQSNEEKPS